MLNFSNVELLPTVVAVAVYMFLGFLWYSPLFGEQWIRLSGAKTGGGSMLYPLLIQLITGVMMACVLSTATAGYNLTMSLEIALLLWLTFIGLLLGTNYAYGSRPFALWLIDAGYPFVGMLLMTMIINQMRPA